MRTGIVLPTTLPGLTGRRLLDWAATAEGLGFDSLAVLDRGEGYDPFVALAMAAAVTERVELVADVQVRPVRKAAALAEQVGSLDHASGRRLTVGVRLRDDRRGLTGIDFGVRDALLDDHLRHLAGHRLLLGGTAADAARRLPATGDGWAMTATGSPEQFAVGMAAVEVAWFGTGRAGRPRGVAVTDDATSLGAFEAAGATDVLLTPRSGDLAELELLADAALRTLTLALV